MNELSSTECDASGTRRRAFLDLLQSHADSIVSESDLKEYYPHIEWRGAVADTWRELTDDEAISPHLRSYGDGKSRVYAFITNPDDDTILKERIVATAIELEQPSDLFQSVKDEGLHVDKKIVERWWKIAVIAGVAVTAMTTTGIAVYHKVHKSR